MGVQLLLEKAQRGEKYTQLTVSEEIKFINKAWRQVISSTISNYWKKDDIIIMN